MVWVAAGVKGTVLSTQPRLDEERSTGTMWDRVLNGLNWLLVANLFFVLGSFGWFAVAVIGRSLNVDLGLEIWYSLWTPVFQPTIGILMAGAIAIGALRWLSGKIAAFKNG